MKAPSCRFITTCFLSCRKERQDPLRCVQTYSSTHLLNLYGVRLSCGMERLDSLCYFEQGEIKNVQLIIRTQPVTDYLQTLWGLCNDSPLHFYRCENEHNCAEHVHCISPLLSNELRTRQTTPSSPPLYQSFQFRSSHYSQSFIHTDGIFLKQLPSI